jgi:hypothetical protein
MNANTIITFLLAGASVDQWLFGVVTFDGCFVRGPQLPREFRKCRIEARCNKLHTRD